jgi:hypothetical protein
VTYPTGLQRRDHNPRVGGSSPSSGIERKPRYGGNAAVTAKKLHKNAVTTKKIKNNAVNGAKVNESSLGPEPRAGIGESPVAYARVEANGAVDAAN